MNRQKECDVMQKTAKYKQIEDYIKQEISRKNLQIGDQNVLIFPEWPSIKH